MMPEAHSVPALRIDASAWYGRPDFQSYLESGYFVHVTPDGATGRTDAFTYWEDSLTHNGCPQDISDAVDTLLAQAHIEEGVVWFINQRLLDEEGS